MIIERCLQCNRFKDDDAILCHQCYSREKFLSFLRDIPTDEPVRAVRARARFARLVQWAMNR